MSRLPKGDYVYMMVTQDDLSLPILIADSTEELAKKVGVKASGLRSAISHSKEHLHPKYIRVKID